MSLKSWGHALPFDGEIKDLVPLKSGPLLTSLIAVIAILCILLGYHLQKHYASHFTFEREVKKECLVGFNRREAGREAGFCFYHGWRLFWGWQRGKWLLTQFQQRVAPARLHPFAYASIPQLLLRKEQDTSNKQIKDFLGGHEMGHLKDKSFVRITPKVARVGKAGQCQSPLPYYY